MAYLINHALENICRLMLHAIYNLQNFPEGMVMPHQKALENKRKNRYRNLFACKEHLLLGYYGKHCPNEN